MGRITAIAAAALLTAAPVFAGPLDPDVVPADATWIVHMDVEAATTSTVGRYVLEHPEQFDLEQGLHDIRDELGLDPVDDLFGLTLFGAGDPDETGVVVLTMSSVIDDLVETATAEDAIRAVTVEGLTLYRWEDGGDAYYAWVSGRGKRRHVIVAQKQALVLDAVRVREGHRSSLDADDETVKPKAGSILFATARGLPWVGHDEEALAAVLKRTNRLRLEIRETDDWTRLELVASARSIEDATNVSQVLQGVVALGRLAAAESPDLRGLGELLGAVSFTAYRNDVKMQCEMPSEHVVAMLQMMSDQ